jgi:hypothetical protein
MPARPAGLATPFSGSVGEAWQGITLRSALACQLDQKQPESSQDAPNSGALKREHQRLQRRGHAMFLPEPSNLQGAAKGDAGGLSLWELKRQPRDGHRRQCAASAVASAQDAEWLGAGGNHFTDSLHSRINHALGQTLQAWQCSPSCWLSQTVLTG